MVQSRECPPYYSVHCWGVFSSLLPSSLQMRNFPNRMLAETPLVELVEEGYKYLMCDWEEMENEHQGVRMGARLERALGISVTFRSNEKGRSN